MTINEKIRNQRISLGLTLEEVAKHVGVSKATVLRWENGDIANMRRDKIGKLADALNVPPTFIMGLDDTPQDQSDGAAPNKILIPGTKLTDDENDVIADYRKLNAVGKDKAKEYINDLTENEKYTENPSSKFNDKAIG